MRKSIHKALVWAAGTAGVAVGLVRRTAVGTVGALLVSYGLWLAWAPLGFICAGGFLLLLDRRVS